MKYINQKLSAKLKKLGLVSDSGMWWKTFDDAESDYVPILLDYPVDSDDNVLVSAFNLLDILNPDNLKKLFGEKKIDEWGMTEADRNNAGGIGAWGFSNLSWQYHGQKLLEAYWQGWDELEKYLENKLKGKK